MHTGRSITDTQLLLSKSLKMCLFVRKCDIFLLMSRGQSAFPLYLQGSWGNQGGIFASPFILKKKFLKFVNTSAFCEHLLSIGKNLKWIICTVITTAAIH